jgi:ElaB/YqjD/DUF883 family membrane-anchored ribosome-binding protein
MSYNKREVESEAENLIHSMTEKAEAIEHEVEAYAKQTTQYIKKNPVKSTVIAAVAGILFGKFFG